MIETTQQRDLVLEAIQRLERQLLAEPLPGVPLSFLEGHRADTRRSIGELCAEIADFEFRVGPRVQ